MYDINNTLKLFAKDFKMNYCKDFDIVKGILEYCDVNVKRLEKVQFRGGNEKIINEISERLQSHFIESNYICKDSKLPLPDSDKILQKITLFLVLNTDITYKYNLKNEPDIAHVLEVCPQLTKFLLVSVIWEAKLDKYFYQLLAYTPCWFSFQLVETAVGTLKHIDEPYEVLEKVQNLIKSIFISISRAEERYIDFCDKKIIFGKLYDYSMELLRQFYTPDAEKFKAFTKKQFFKYSGYAVKNLLDSLIFCFDGFEEIRPYQLNDDLEIYNICTLICPANTEESALTDSSIIENNKMKIITALLNSLQYNVCLISIDVFMYWVEIDLSDSETLQSAIGALAYHALKRMETNPQFGHDIAAQLKSIAIRPKTLTECIKEATIGDVLRKLDDDNTPEKQLWFNELFNRPIVFGNDECLESIKDNLKLITIENCEKIFEYIRLEYINMQDEQDDADETMQCDCINENLYLILLKAVENFNSDQILVLIGLQIKIFGHRTRIIQQEDFDERCTSFFNKFVNAFDLQAYLCLCFEHPHATWMKFFDEACATEEHIRNFCTTVKQTQKVCNVYFEEILSGLFSSNKSEERFFPNFICEIYFELYYHEKQIFFKRFFNKNVNEMLEFERYDHLAAMVKALNLIANRPNHVAGNNLNFGEVTAPVLLMAAQIVEKCRWDLVSYSDVKDEIVRGGIEFIQTVSKKFLSRATEKDKKWINKVIKDSYRPTTQYYFQKYSLPLGEPQKTFDKFLIPLQIEDKSEAEMFLIINYVRCTSKETEWLAKSNRLLPHISDMILILGGIVADAGNPNAINNYRHCMMNYANIVNKFIIPQLTNSADLKQIEKLAMKLLKIIQSAPIEIYDEIFISFEGVLLKVCTLLQKPVDEEFVKGVRKYVASMKKCRGSEIFLEKFQTLVTEMLS